MKRPLLITILCLGSIAATPSASFAEWLSPQEFFQDLPREHWSYSCLTKLGSLTGMSEEIRRQPHRLMTRYEFAILYERANDLQAQKPELSDPVTKDILAVFHEEFKEELECLHSPDPTNYYRKGSRPGVKAPPKLANASTTLMRTGYKSYVAEQPSKKPETENR